MNLIHAEETQIINARPEEIYAVLADYQVGHRAILPKPYFTDMLVEKGGYGAGTEILVKMKVMGVESQIRQVVSEPEPGRLLVEGDEQTGIVTSFRLEPLADGNQTQVTIATDMPASPGIKGWVEKWLNPLVLRRIYRAELQQLATYLQKTTD